MHIEASVPNVKKIQLEIVARHLLSSPGLLCQDQFSTGWRSTKGIAKMTDVFEPAVRSRVMARIRGKDTGLELAVRSFLHAKGVRYRLNRRDRPGCPDISNRSRRFAIFVNGCFWHSHLGCRYAVRPKSRTAFWDDKLRRTVIRDQKAVSALTDKGYRVATVWGCSLKPAPRAKKSLARLLKWIDSGRRNLEL